MPDNVIPIVVFSCKKKVFVSYFLDLVDSLMSPVAKGTVREPAGSYLFIDKTKCQ